MIRTSKKTVTFRRRFSLGGLDEALPAGTYRVETDEEPLVGVSFSAYRRQQTFIYLNTDPGNPAHTRVLTIDPDELEAALERDKAPVSSPA